MSKLLQPNLSGGEVSPAIAARIDFAKYKTSVSEALNLNVRVEGGMENRPGTQYVAQVKDSTQAVRLIDFSYNTEQTYILEFGDLYIRFHTGGAQILDSADVNVISGATQANPVTLTVTAHTFITGDEIYIADVVGMTELNGRNFKIVNTGANTFTLRDLNGSTVDGTAYTAYISDGTATPPYEVVTPYTEDQLFDLAYVQTNDVMTITHELHAPRELSRVDNDDWSLDLIVYTPDIGYPGTLAVTPAVTGAVTARYAVTAVSRDTAEESLKAITASLDTITAVTNASPAVVTAAGTAIVEGDEIVILAVVGMTELNGNRYIATNVAGSDFELYTPSGNAVDSTDFAAWSSGGTLHTAHRKVTNNAATVNTNITWAAVDGAESYNVYKEDNGIFGFIGRTEALTFNDDNIEPDVSDTPPRIRDPFEQGANYYPATVSYSDQRRIFARSITYPQRFWMTQIANFRNFSVSSPTRDDDAITGTIADRQANSILHIFPTRDLIMLTAAAEWKIFGVDDLMTPSNIKRKPQSFYGSTSLRPISVGNVAIFMQPGQIVRDFLYEFSSDKYNGNDLTILARHLFDDNSVVDWGYSQAGQSILWAVRDDGVLLSLTYNREQEVYGWTRNVTRGFFKSVAVVREGQRDIPYFVVERKINGFTVKFIERLHHRKFTDVRDGVFVDASLSLDTPIAITGYTNASPVVVTSEAHTLVNGDVIDISDVYATSTDNATTGRALVAGEINANGFIVANATADTFELTDSDASNVDGTDWGVYDSSGFVRVATTSISGLWHLEGETLTALANGYATADVVVTDGAVTLAQAASRVHLGLPYTSRLVPLPVYLETKAGPTSGKQIKVSKLDVRVVRTLGLWHGPDTSTMREAIFGQPTLYGQPPDMVTETIPVTLKPDWKKDNTYVLEQRDPLPLTIVSLTPDITVGG